jgi:hypothetical protein
MSCTINGSAGLTTNSGAVYNGISSGTAVASTSGTSIDFTGIPSWVKRITVMFAGMSLSGTSLPQVQLGDSGGVETTGYSGRVYDTASGNNAGTTGIILSSDGSNASVYVGTLTINLLNSNQWVAIGILSRTDSTNQYYTAYSKTLSDVLDRIRITTVNGTDTFDAGSINILYE